MQSKSIWKVFYHIMDTFKQQIHTLQSVGRHQFRLRLQYCRLFVLPVILHATSAQASIFKGAALDKAADILSWVVLIIVPIVGIVAFWLVHILPEKIAEKRKHPQAKAIQTLCLLSLVFGGLLWPIAWLWAYTKPVLYKLAYGTDTVEPEHGGKNGPAADTDDTQELQRLRSRLAELETKLAVKAASEGGKA